uniref:Putative ATP-dependent RNA helicase DDX28 n=1 Tax=Magallana gigas TaxID=29159 RepID=K1Q154_MAGGI
MIRKMFVQRCLIYGVKNLRRQVSTKEIPTLTVPKKMARNIEKVKLRKIIQEESLKQQRKGALVISCKNKEYNFYSSGKFDENDPKALASHGWKHRKSYIARDFFTINAVSTNPALLRSTEQCGFADLDISEELCQRLSTAGIEVPTDIQAKVTYMKSEPIDVFIATPGALKKFLTYGRIKHSQLQHFVLDEADTLLDDSFFHEVRSILTNMLIHGGVGVQGQGSTGVQLSLVSATMPRDLQKNIGSLISVR